VRHAEAAAEHLGLLREHEDGAAVDGAVTRDDTVAVDLLLEHAEVVARVRDEAVELDERFRIEQHLDALACRHAASGVEARERLLRGLRRRLDGRLAGMRRARSRAGVGQSLAQMQLVADVACSLLVGHDRRERTRDAIRRRPSSTAHRSSPRPACTRLAGRVRTP
jgi:hypothetical protein